MTTLLGMSLVLITKKLSLEAKEEMSFQEFTLMMLLRASAAPSSLSICGRQLLPLLKYRFKGSYLRWATLSISTGWRDFTDVEMSCVLSPAGGHTVHLQFESSADEWLVTAISAGYERTPPASREADAMWCAATKKILLPCYQSENLQRCIIEVF